MRARKVAIMLAITALTGVTLFVMSLIDGRALGAEPTATAAAPDTLAYLSEWLTIGPDGDALVEVAAVLAKGGSGDLLLPFAFDAAVDFAISSGPIRFARDAAGADRPQRVVLGHRMLDLEILPTAQAGDTVSVRARVPGWFARDEARRPFGEFALRRGYVNTSRFALRRFELGTRLPDGMLVHSVTDASPAYNPKLSPTPPYALGRVGDRGWAALRLENLDPAGRCRLDLLVRPGRRGPVPLIAGLACAVLYLAFFRDVLAPGDKE